MTKATVKQYIPTFFEGYTPTIAEVGNLRELLDIVWVAKFKEGEGFVRFSKKTEHDGATVFAEYLKEKLIVCFIDDKNIVSGLPDYETKTTKSDNTQPCGPRLMVLPAYLVAYRIERDEENSAKEFLIVTPDFDEFVNEYIDITKHITSTPAKIFRDVDGDLGCEVFSEADIWKRAYERKGK